ncbi:hypothetical protein B6U99_06190 [Candidatus Geothermarchaeota archaeon ex4572_27]|nr:MAG: hypothetical protein B6U99_06190 [Candidatus Geothermarchaeota archaeon ex4572_27]
MKRYPHSSPRDRPVLRYVFSAPSELEALRGRLGTDVCNRILYLVSIAVKDYEVTSLLLERGLAGTQPQFLRYVLRVSDEEVRTWRAAWSAEAKILHLLSVFKVLACAWPMARRGEYASEVGRWIGDAVSYLPASYSSALYSLLGALEGARGTTHEKVYAVVREAVRLLVLPLLGGRET